MVKRGSHSKLNSFFNKKRKPLVESSAYGLDFAIKAKMLTDIEIKAIQEGYYAIKGHQLIIGFETNQGPVLKNIIIADLYPGRREQLDIDKLLGLDKDNEIPF